MTQPKFIITMDGYFRLGMVHMHSDLLKPETSASEVVTTYSIMLQTELSLTVHHTTSASRSGTFWTL